MAKPTKPRNCLHPSDFRELNSSNKALPQSAYCLCSLWCAISAAIPAHLGTERDPNYCLTALYHTAVRLSDKAFSSIEQIYKVWLLFSEELFSFFPLTNVVISTHSLGNMMIFSNTFEVLDLHIYSRGFWNLASLISSYHTCSEKFMLLAVT